MRALIADVMLAAGGARLGLDPVLSGQSMSTGVGSTWPFGGLALNEPVVHYGPFVMNTVEEIERAMRDYREGVLVRT